LTIKYRKSLPVIEELILEIFGGFKERYHIDVGTVGFDRNHVQVFAQVFGRPGDPADKEHNFAYPVQGIASSQKGPLGRLVLDARLLHLHCEWQGATGR
jgi:hypothetical protein